MKKILLTFFLASFGFANTLPQDLSYRNPLTENEKTELKSFTYFKFSGGENNLLHPQQPSPGLGVGFRYKAESSAFDICVSGVGLQEKRSKNHQFLFPKISYISYINPLSEKPFYHSLGLAWGITENQNQKFTGIIAHASLGYEFFRSSEFLSFYEATVYQPALSIKELDRFPSPTLEMCIGMGF